MMPTDHVLSMYHWYCCCCCVCVSLQREWWDGTDRTSWGERRMSAGSADDQQRAVDLSQMNCCFSNTGCTCHTGPGAIQQFLHSPFCNTDLSVQRVWFNVHYKLIGWQLGVKTRPRQKNMRKWINHNNRKSVNWWLWEILNNSLGIHKGRMERTSRIQCSGIAKQVCEFRTHPLSGKYVFFSGIISL